MNVRHSLVACVASVALVGASLSLGACTTRNTGAGAASATVQAATSSGSTDSNITFRNSSNWAIYRLHMSPVSQSTWGPDQLGAHVIPAGGGSYTLTNIPCNSYDVKLVDEDGDECVVNNVDICADNHTVNITNERLLNCQAFTRANQ